MLWEILKAHPPHRYDSLKEKKNIDDGLMFESKFFFKKETNILNHHRNFLKLSSGLIKLFIISKKKKVFKCILSKFLDKTPRDLVYA
jgi:hypothetical protein